MQMTTMNVGGIDLTPADLPAGVQRMLVWIDGPAAKALLNANEENRRLDQALARTYARMMLKRGGWPYVGDPARIDKNGKTLDGQHRFRAVELASLEDPNFRLLMDVITGLEPDTRANMDAGRTRKAADQARMDGMKNSQTCASASRLLMRWGYPDGWLLASNNYRPAHPEVVDFMRNHPDLEGAAGVGFSVYMAVGVKPSVATAFYYRAKEVDVFRAAEFMHTLRTGENIGLGHPLHTMRNKVIRARKEQTPEEQDKQLYVMVDAWNHWTLRETNFKFMPPRGGITATTEFKLNDRILLTDEEWTPRKP